MGLTWIDQSNRLALAVGAALFVAMAPRVSPAVVWGLSAGLLLSALNLWVLRHLVARMFLSNTSALMRLALVLQFPLLLGVAFLALCWSAPAAFAVGFSLPLAVIVLKMGGRFLRAGSFRAFAEN